MSNKTCQKGPEQVVKTESLIERKIEIFLLLDSYLLGDPGCSLISTDELWCSYKLAS
jgi:hypothetical protein